jgi:hypothetical protein
MNLRLFFSLVIIESLCVVGGFGSFYFSFFILVQGWSKPDKAMF